MDLGKLVTCILLFLVLSIPLTELLLRTFTEQSYTPGYLITDPVRHYALKPGFQGKTYDAPFSINLEGIRDDEPNIPIRENEFRIAIFGDSMAFGQGIPLSQTLEKETESMLNKDRSLINTRSFRVINFAVPGYNFATQVDYLKEIYSRFKPGLVVFAFSIQQQTLLAPSAQMNQIPWIRELKDFLRNLYSYVYFSNRFYSFEKTFQAESKLDETDKLQEYYRDDYPGWQACKKSLESLAEFSKINNIPVVIAIVGDEGKIFPNLDQDPLKPMIEKLKITARNAGINHLLLVDDGLRNYANRDSEIMLRLDDNHYSARAHQQVGKYLYEYLSQNPGLLGNAP